MSENVINTLFYLTPLIVGGVIAAVNGDAANGATERAEAWIRGRQQRTSGASGWFSAYVLNPVLWAIVKFSDWTDGFSHRGLKNGTRVAATFYLVGLWLMVLYAAVIVVIAIVVLIIALWVLGQMLAGSSPSSTEYSDSTPSRRVRDEEEDVASRVSARGQKVYAGTNWFNEELKGRVDDDGNIYKGTNWFNEEKIGRIDDDGTIYRGTKWMNEERIGRVDSDGTLYKGSNWFTEEKTGRIADDGTVYEGTNWFNEEKTGRTGE